MDLDNVDPDVLIPFPHMKHAEETEHKMIGGKMIPYVRPAEKYIEDRLERATAGYAA
jgi:hypothetical protein